MNCDSDIAYSQKLSSFSHIEITMNFIAYHHSSNALLCSVCMETRMDTVSLGVDWSGGCIKMHGFCHGA